MEKRIDVIATAQRLGATVMDLEKLRLTYAPPYSSARIGQHAWITAVNMMRGDVAVFHYHDVADLDRIGSACGCPVKESLPGSIAGAVHIPLEELRDRLDELPQDRRFIYSAESAGAVISLPESLSRTVSPRFLVSVAVMIISLGGSR